jgi:DHA1 family inner membrane transport protein
MIDFVPFRGVHNIMPIAVYALALAAFAVGTAEFVISGILPALAGDLGVTIPTAGLLVSAYAVGVAVGGPVLTLLAARIPPKPQIVGLMLIFAFAQVLCALAPNYELLLLARLLSSVVHGVFFGVGNVLVSGQVPKERRGGAFALFIGGITVANLLGVPGGTAIGVAFGWRATFLLVAVFGLIASAVLAWRLPPTPADAQRGPSLAEQVRALNHQQVWLSYLTIALVMVGLICFSTYQVPILLNVTRLTPEVVPFYLLAGGLGSVLGIYAGGRATDWRPMPSLIAVLVVQALVFILVAVFADDRVYMAMLMLAMGVAGFAFSTPLQARIIHAAGAAPNLASALISTAFNTGIAIGAFLGAVLLNAGVHYADLPAVGTVTALLAAATAALSWWLERRRAGFSPAPP